MHGISGIEVPFATLLDVKHDLVRADAAQLCMPHVIHQPLALPRAMQDLFTKPLVNLRACTLGPLVCTVNVPFAIAAESARLRDVTRREVLVAAATIPREPIP